ncbi:hypothetical protein N9878_00705 [bacterium]|nr:hypothetical protein [bacterium]
MGDILDTGKGDRAKKQAELQQRELAAQKQKEQLRSAEAGDATSRTAAAAKSGGTRSSLLKTSPTGLAKKLGG